MGFESTTCFRKKDCKGLKSYTSDIETMDAISYIKSKYGNEQVSYKYEKCEFWHLSPAKRQTESRTCSCLDSNNKHKQLYLSKQNTENRKNIIYNETEKQLRIYSCPVSSGYHLTNTHGNQFCKMYLNYLGAFLRQSLKNCSFRNSAIATAKFSYK